MFTDYTGSFNNRTQGFLMKQRHLVHLHQQMRVLGDHTVLFLTRPWRSVTFADYTALCINQTQDVVTKQWRVLLLHHQTQDKTLLLLARLVHLETLANYTVSCNNYTQGFVMKQRRLVHLHEMKALDDIKAAVPNKTCAFGDVFWLHRILYKPHARCGDKTAVCGASILSNTSDSRQNTAFLNKTNAFGNVY